MRFLLAFAFLSILLMACTTPDSQPPASPAPGASGGGGSIVIETSVSEMAEQADLIVVGTVLASASRWNDQHNLIYTDTSISVENTLKGTAQTQITVTTLGGEVDGITLSTSEGTSFQTGDKLLLFLYGEQGQAWQIINGSQGRYLVEDGKVAGTNLTPSQFLQAASAASVESSFQRTPTKTQQ